MEPVELFGSASKTTREGGITSPVRKNTTYGPLKPGMLGLIFSFNCWPFAVSTTLAFSQPGMLSWRTSGFNNAENTCCWGALIFWVPVISMWKLFLLVL